MAPYEAEARAIHSRFWFCAIVFAGRQLGSYGWLIVAATILFRDRLWANFSYVDRFFRFKKTAAVERCEDYRAITEGLRVQFRIKFPDHR
jgi:hypothetical protein